MPLKMARIYEEDILDQVDNDGHSALMTQPLEILDNYTKMIEEGRETQLAYAKAKQSQMSGRSFGSGNVAEHDEVFSSERSSTIYTKSSAGADKMLFEDFQIISIIGKGSFGKVIMRYNSVGVFGLEHEE